MIGQRIKLLKPLAHYEAGSIGTITGDCGCVSLPKWVVKMEFDRREIQIAKRNTKGYERWEWVN